MAAEFNLTDEQVEEFKDLGPFFSECFARWRQGEVAPTDPAAAALAFRIGVAAERATLRRAARPAHHRIKSCDERPQISRKVRDACLQTSAAKVQRSPAPTSRSNLALLLSNPGLDRPSPNNPPLNQNC